MHYFPDNTNVFGQSQTTAIRHRTIFKAIHNIPPSNHNVHSFSKSSNSETQRPTAHIYLPSSFLPFSTAFVPIAFMTAINHPRHSPPHALTFRGPESLKMLAAVQAICWKSCWFRSDGPCVVNHRQAALNSPNFLWPSRE